MNLESSGRWERGLTFAGAGLGLSTMLGAVSLVVVRLVRDETAVEAEPWHLWLVAFGVFPYALAIAAASFAAARPVVRFMALGASTIIAAWVALFSYFLFAPAFLLLAAALVASMRAALHADGEVAPVPWLLAAGGIVAAWFSGVRLLLRDDMTFADGMASMPSLVAAVALAAFVFGWQPRARNVSPTI